MNILFLSNHRNNSYAQNLILAIKKIGMGIICRNIDENSSSQKTRVHPIIEQLEQENLNCEVCIQFVHPSLIIGTSKFHKNIAIVSMDQSINAKYATWTTNLQLIDEIWVFTEEQKNNLCDFVETPIKIIPPPLSSIDEIIHYMYNTDSMLDKSVDYYGIDNVGNTIKEYLNA